MGHFVKAAGGQPGARRTECHPGDAVGAFDGQLFLGFPARDVVDPDGGTFAGDPDAALFVGDGDAAAVWMPGHRFDNLAAAYAP